jgi:PTH1 family peptidyl-tRNA hydrolase
VVLAKPQTFMNLSGESIDAILTHYQIPKTQMLVVYDDLDTAVASLKLKGKGGHGGHNGGAGGLPPLFPPRRCF